MTAMPELYPNCRCITLEPGELKDIIPPTMTRNQIELGINPRTGEDRGSIEGIRRVGEFIFTTNGAKDDDFLAARQRGNKQSVKIKMIDGTAFKFDGYVTSVISKSPVDGLVETEVKIRPTGSMNIEHQPVIKEAGPVKIRNRFYIAHPKITSINEQGQDNTFTPNTHRAGDLYGRWSKKTLKDALAHAEEHLEKNPTVDHVAIVQVIRTVRRKKAPLVVETVK